MTAPYDCIITEYSVPETGTKASSSNYVKIKDLKNLTVMLSINESEILSISEGQDVKITLNADESITYTGEISKISATGTYASNGSSFTAYVNFENDGNATIGMSVSCEITIEEKENVIAVPIEAVEIEDNSRYVVVAQNGETKNVEIETGISDDTYVEIISGLSGGETIQITEEITESEIRSSTSDTNSDFMSGGGAGMFEFSGELPQMTGGSGRDFGGQMGGQMPN